MFCATHSIFTDLFSQTCQFLFVEAIVKPQAVLDWLKMARNSSKTAPKRKEESDSYASEEEEEEIPIVEPEFLNKFV